MDTPSHLLDLTLARMIVMLMESDVSCPVNSSLGLFFTLVWPVACLLSRLTYAATGL